MPAQFRKLFFVLISFLLLTGLASAQTAVPSADICKVRRTVHNRPHLVAKLPDAIKETSGLTYFNKQLWTMNDSGNPPDLYMLDTLSGAILRTVAVRNAKNTDWESMTCDEQYVYVGDFGNNGGNRKDLHILKIRKSDLLNPAKDSVNAGFIRFHFEDQTDYTPASNQNNYDCEAMLCANGLLHLFSKDWTDVQTRHYILPTDTGTFTAVPIETMATDGLVTDACINKKGDIALLGYKHTFWKIYVSFAWLLSDTNGNHFFTGNRQRIKLGNAFHLGQTEGIVLKNDNTAWISSESILSGILHRRARLFRVRFSF